MPTWPINLGLGASGTASLLLDGLGASGGGASGGGGSPGGGSSGGGGGPAALSRRRTIVPAAISGYAGRDFPALSIVADDVFGIDLGAALDDGDRLVASTLALIFFPVEGGSPSFTAAVDGPAGLIGTVAAQAIGRPPAGRYLLGFTCGTANGRTIAIHSFFNAVGLPNAS